MSDNDEKMLRKTFYISQYLYENSKKISNQMGIRYPEYIRHLVSIDVRNFNKNPIESLSDKERKELSRIMHEIEKGRFVSSRDLLKVLWRFVG